MSKNICKVALLISLGMFGFNAIADTAVTPPPSTPGTQNDKDVKKDDKDAKKDDKDVKKDKFTQ